MSLIGASLIGASLIGMFLTGPSHRRASLIGVHLGQACGSRRTYISQTCALDRRVTLTGHTLTENMSHGSSDFDANGQLDINCPYYPPHS
jgi:hypothetical protein